jgi:ATP-dependent RNA helicase DHX36
MQNNHYPRSFLNPNAATFNYPRAQSRFSTTAADRARHGDAVPQSEEAWTQYDGLGPVPQVNRNLDRNWRTGGSARGNNAQGGFGRRNQQSRGGSPVNQPASKRTKQMQQSGNGRGARGGISGRGGGRLASAPDREIIDEAYLERNLPEIKKEDYPNAPNAIFSNPKGFLWDSKTIQARSAFASQRGGMFQCTVFLKLSDGGRIEATGDSANKVSF